MTDKFGNNYVIAEQPNSHQLITGSSGYGKSFQLCRRIEELFAQDKMIILLDFSNSFSVEERRKNRLHVNSHVEEFDYTSGNLKLIYITGEEIEVVSGNLADILMNVAKIKDKKKRNFLENVINHLFNKQGASGVCLSDILDCLEEVQNKLRFKEQKKIIEEIIGALDIVCAVNFVRFYVGAPPISIGGSIELFQLSNLSIRQRAVIAEFLLLFLWENKKRKIGFCDYLVIDEIQNLNLAENSAIAFILREGRKFNLGMILATQFISSLDKEAKLTLEQVAHRLYLRPTNGDVRGIAKELDRKSGPRIEWERILSNLKVGEGIFSGYTTINNNKKIHEITMKMYL